MENELEDQYPTLNSLNIIDQSNNASIYPDLFPVNPIYPYNKEVTSSECIFCLYPIKITSESCIVSPCGHFVHMKCAEENIINEFIICKRCNFKSSVAKRPDSLNETNSYTGSFNSISARCKVRSLDMYKLKQLEHRDSPTVFQQARFLTTGDISSSNDWMKVFTEREKNTRKYNISKLNAIGISIADLYYRFKIKEWAQLRELEIKAIDLKSYNTDTENSAALLCYLYKIDLQTLVDELQFNLAHMIESTFTALDFYLLNINAKIFLTLNPTIGDLKEFYSISQAEWETFEFKKSQIMSIVKGLQHFDSLHWNIKRFITFYKITPSEGASMGISIVSANSNEKVAQPKGGPYKIEEEDEQDEVQYIYPPSSIPIRSKIEREQISSEKIKKKSGSSKKTSSKKQSSKH